MADDQLFQRFGRSFPRGTVLFREGVPGREMYVVQQGRVTISKRVGDVEKILSSLGAGEFLGEMSILNQKPRSATATCAEDSKLLVIDAKTFEAMIRSNAEIAIRMIKKLADRLHEADEQIENLLFRDASARVGVRPEQAADVVSKLVKASIVRLLPDGFLVPDVAKLRHFLDFLQMKAQFEGGA